LYQDQQSGHHQELQNSFSSERN